MSGCWRASGLEIGCSGGGADERSQPPKRWHEADGVHIDVRGLAPPQPLVAILRLVHEQGDSGAAVIVHHDRDPLLLYPELAEIGWVAQRIDAPPGEVRLRLLGPNSLRGTIEATEPTEPEA